jgi:hypothetical protein
MAVCARSPHDAFNQQIAHSIPIVRKHGIVKFLEETLVWARVTNAIVHQPLGIADPPVAAWPRLAVL